MITEVARNVLRFITLTLIQVLVLNNVEFSGYINPLLYVLFILMLPFETAKWLVLILGFITGLTIDAFTDTMGMHTSACVFTSFCRPYILNFISPRDGYEPGMHPTMQQFGWVWFLTYAGILVFIHHFILFYLEVFRFNEFFFTFFKVIASWIFTLLIMFLTQFLLYRTKGR